MYSKSDSHASTKQRKNHDQRKETHKLPNRSSIQYGSAVREHAHNTHVGEATDDVPAVAALLPDWLVSTLR